MKLIIAGGRDYKLVGFDYNRLDILLLRYEITEIVSGGARGVDTAGELWAKQNSIPVKRFPANWERYGSYAGPVRNRQMAVYADAVALFPGGAGTRNMYEQAVEHGLTIFDYRNRDYRNRVLRELP